MAQSYTLDDLDEPTTQPNKESYTLDDLPEPSKKASSESKGWADSLSPTTRQNMQTLLPVVGALAAEALAIPATAGMSGLAIPATIATAAGLGSLGGEAANQYLGVKPIDFEEQAYAFGLPGIGRQGMAMLAGLPRMIPGMATAIKAAHIDDIKAMAGKLLPGPDPSHVYAELAKQSISSTKLKNFPELEKTVTSLSKDLDKMPWEELEKKLGEQGLGNLFNQIKGSLKGTQPTTTMANPTVGGKPLSTSGLPKQATVVPGQEAGLTFDEARSAIEGLNKVMDGTTDKAVRGSYYQIKKALLGDLERMPSMPGVPLDKWREAQHAYKMERARTSLLEATEKSIVTKDGIDIPHPDRIISWLRKEGKEEIMSRVGAQEYRKILNEYRLLASNIGHDMPRLFALIAGGTVGALASGSGGAAAVGASTGFMLSEQLTKLMMSDTGRKIVRWYASDPRASLTRRGGTLLGAWGAAQSSESEE